MASSTRSASRSLREPWRLLRGSFSLAVAFVLVLLLLPLMFAFGLITGLGFLFSCALALWRGVFWRSGSAVLLIALGYAITSIAAHLLIPAALSDWKNESYLAAGLFVAVFVFIWWRVRHLKDGKRKL